MHYYQFHIGDYASHTRHLSLIEDLAYRRLLDFYYLHEQPIKQREIGRQIGMREHEQDVLTVLNEFFVSTENGYINPRADAEIAKYREFSEAGRRGAAKRWAGHSPPISPPIGLPNATPIATNNHKPITNNHIKKEQQRGSRLPADFALTGNWISFCEQERPDLTPQKVFEQFKDYWTAQPGQKGVKLDWEATWRNWVRRQSQPRPSFAQQTADVARLTVPAVNKGPDPVLLKIAADRQKAAAPSLEVLERMAQIKRSAMK